MFRDALEFNQPIGTWTVSSVTSFDELFNPRSMARKFNQDLDGWDTSRVDKIHKCL